MVLLTHRACPVARREGKDDYMNDNKGLIPGRETDSKEIGAVD